MTVQIHRSLKCPYCSFRNIHEEEIIHHIKHKQNTKHQQVNLDKIDRASFIVTKWESRYHYEKKEDLPLPWIKCLWCDYKDKIERDLERHFIERHRDRLNKIKVSPEERRADPVWTHDPFSWMYSDLEYRIYKALNLAKNIGDQN